MLLVDDDSLIMRQVEVLKLLAQLFFVAKLSAKATIQGQSLEQVTSKMLPFWFVPTKSNEWLHSCQEAASEILVVVITYANQYEPQAAIISHYWSLMDQWLVT